MARKWNGWGDRYDAYGVAAGLPMFLVVGSVLDVGLGAGASGWLIAFTFFAATTNVTSYVLRRRGPDGDVVREHLAVRPRALAYSAVLAAGAAVLGAGIGLGEAWLAVLGAVAFIAGAVLLTRLKLRQVAAFRAALDERRST